MLGEGNLLYCRHSFLRVLMPLAFELSVPFITTNLILATFIAVYKVRLRMRQNKGAKRKWEQR